VAAVASAAPALSAFNAAARTAAKPKTEGLPYIVVSSQHPVLLN
jgi:hypothetical protein